MNKSNKTIKAIKSSKTNFRDGGPKSASLPSKEWGAEPATLSRESMSCVYVYKRPAGQRKQQKQPDEPFLWNGYYTGIKYQCVELARRYYLIKYNLLFESVENAKDIVELSRILDLDKGTYVAWPTYPNKAASPPPTVGSLLVWDSAGVYAPTGHVAVVTYAGWNFVDIAEQNHGTGHRRLPFKYGVIMTPGLIGWKQPL